MCGIYYTMIDQNIHAKNNKSTINLNIVPKNYETAILKALDQGKLNAEEIYRMNIYYTPQFLCMSVVIS